jgi:hypothetical protein
VDGSYFSGHLALRSEKDFGIQLVGPAKHNSHHAQVQNGYDVSAFKIDWNECYAECPQGKYSSVGGYRRLQLDALSLQPSSLVQTADNAK